MEIVRKRETGVLRVCGEKQYDALGQKGDRVVSKYLTLGSKFVAWVGKSQTMTEDKDAEL